MNPDGSLRDAQAGSFLDHLKEYPDAYHPRRTLDQYYHSHIKNTEARDLDQVATRQTKNALSEGTLIVIDQLWLHLWFLETEGEVHAPARILTAFPYTAYARSGPRGSNIKTSGIYDNADVLEMAVRNLEFQDWKTIDSACAQTLACSILSSAMLSTLSVNGQDSIEFLELFREAIGNATDKYNHYLREFTRTTSQLDAEPGAGTESAKIKQIQLAIEVEDIIDELYMLSGLFDT